MAEELSSQEHFPINSVTDVLSARRRGLEIALTMGFPYPEACKIAVVISELGWNIKRHAGQGSITLTTHAGEGKHIQIVAQDQGPGIPDIERVLAGGYSTSQGLGLGISGSRRLMDEFEIQSVVGEGTTIRVVKSLHYNFRRESGAVRPIG